MKVYGIIGLFALISVYEVPRILKTQQRLKCFFIYYSIIIVSFVISLLQVIEKAPVSPAKIIQTIVKKVV